MFPNLEKTNMISEYNYYDYNYEKSIKDSKMLFDPEKFYSLKKNINDKPYCKDSYIINHYIAHPFNKPYPFFPTNPYYNIFGDWNNTWVKK